jgi:hypothetical protein
LRIPLWGNMFRISCKSFCAFMMSVCIRTKDGQVSQTLLLRMVAENIVFEMPAANCVWWRES